MGAAADSKRIGHKASLFSESGKSCRNGIMF